MEQFIEILFFCFNKIGRFLAAKKVSIRVVFLLNSSRCKYRGSYENGKKNEEEFKGGKEMRDIEAGGEVHPGMVLSQIIKLGIRHGLHGFHGFSAMITQNNRVNPCNPCLKYIPFRTNYKQNVILKRLFQCPPGRNLFSRRPKLYKQAGKSYKANEQNAPGKQAKQAFCSVENTGGCWHSALAFCFGIPLWHSALAF